MSIEACAIYCLTDIFFNVFYLSLMPLLAPFEEKYEFINYNTFMQLSCNPNDMLLSSNQHFQTIFAATVSKWICSSLKFDGKNRIEKNFCYFLCNAKLFIQYHFHSCLPIRIWKKQYNFRLLSKQLKQNRLNSILIWITPQKLKFIRDNIYTIYNINPKLFNCSCILLF